MMSTKLRKSNPSLGKFESFSDQSGAHYHVVNCHGGQSSGPFSSLNVGLRVGDELENVLANRESIRQDLGLENVLFAQQMHGTEIVVIDSSEQLSAGEIGGEDGCDAMITTLDGVGLAIQHADCQAVVLYDAKSSVIAAVHCGWRGNVLGILPQTVQKMMTEFGIAPENLQAFIGPSLGSCCAEFINYKKEFPESFYPFNLGNNHFDLKAISIMQLEESGLKRENITCENTCTSCSPDFFSYRLASRENGGITGRNCTIVYL